MKQFVKVTCHGKPMIINLSSIDDIRIEDKRCVVHFTNERAVPMVIDESFDEICERLDEIMC